MQPFPAAQQTFCLTLTSLDWVHPVPFRVKREELLAAEEILLSSLRQLLGKELKSLAFIRQLGG